jgi:hypothetical protein
MSIGAALRIWLMARPDGLARLRREAPVVLTVVDDDDDDVFAEELDEDGAGFDKDGFDLLVGLSPAQSVGSMLMTLRID